jgi:hypothetical protein
MNIAKKTIVETSVKFDWADESDTSYDLSLYSEEMIRNLALHGLKQKLGDSYSGAEKNGWSIAECKTEVDTVSASMVAGDWNRKGGGFASGGIWVEAAAKATGEEFGAVLEKWNAMDDATKASIKKHPDVKLAKATIELERAKAKAVDAPTLTI